MLYTINHNIHFRDSDGAVWTGEDKSVDHINLTATTSRLLTYMLNHQGEVLLRNDILNYVWVNHGLRESNNSLNRYISDLRKLFVRLGIDYEIIRTVPTIGFMFTHEVVVEKRESPADIINSTINPPRHDSISPSHPCYAVNKIAAYEYILLFFSFLFFAVVLFFTFWNRFALSVDKVTESPRTDGYKLEKIDGCDIVTFKQSSTTLSMFKINMARDILNRSNLNCLPGSKIFFQPTDPVVWGGAGKVFISRCTFNKDDGGIFAGCQSYLEKNYHYAD